MLTPKQEIVNLISLLPEDCTFEDIQYHLYVLQKIEKGLNDVSEGRLYSQNEVEKIMSKWIAE